MNEQPVYENIVCEPPTTNNMFMSINTRKCKTIGLYLKDSLIISLYLALPIAMIVIPLLLLLVPAWAKYQTDSETTKAPVPTPRAMQWGPKNCDTLTVCVYRLEAYIGQNESVIFCLESKSSFLDSVAIYNRKQCKVIRKFNASASRIISKYLKDFFDNDEKYVLTKVTETSKDENCPYYIAKPWVTFCLDTRKSFKSVILGSDVFLNSQEAYKSKIYMIAFN